MKTKNECGSWINDETMIAEELIIDYTHRLKSAHITSIALPDLGLPKIISVLDNQELTKLLNLEEVKIALFNINSNKTQALIAFEWSFSRIIDILSKMIFLTM